jgi:hypothetical protein
MARYFARFSATDGNVYVRLIEAVERVGRFDGTVFASLNYECMLEQALERCSKLVRYFEEAASTGNAACCRKLHGSYNFVPEQEGRITGIAMPRDAPLGLKITPIDYRAVEGYCDGQQGHPSAFDSPLAPTMSVIMRGKPVLFSPPEIRRLQSWWANAVLRAKVVTVIGVRPHPIDAHIWQPLAETEAAVCAVGDRDDFEAWNRTHRSGNGKPFRFLGNFFDQCLSDIVSAM